MPNRIAHQDWTTDAARDSLSDFAERLLGRILLLCDDFGRYYADGSIIAAGSFPRRVGQPKLVSRVEQALAELERAGLIGLYSANGQRFIQFRDWRQQVRAAKSKFPEPPAVAEAPSDIRCAASDSNCDHPLSSAAEAGSAPISISNNDSRIATTSSAAARRRILCDWPEGFELNDAMRQYAIQRGIDPEIEFEHWHADCLAKGRQYRDWEQAWRTRINKAPQFGGGARLRSRMRPAMENLA